MRAAVPNRTSLNWTVSWSRRHYDFEHGVPLCRCGRPRPFLMVLRGEDEEG